MANERDVDPELRKAMDGSLKAYSAGDEHFFDYLAGDITVFSLNSADAIRGREEFRRAFDNFKRKRQVEIVNQEIDMQKDRAVLLQTLEITSEDVTSYIRQTVLWERGERGWHMTHIHNAQVGTPVFTGRAPRDLRSIRVLNERIATVAATVGVAQ